MAKKVKAKVVKKNNSFISAALMTAILYIVVGICLLFGGPGKFVEVISYVIGALFIIEGVLEMFLTRDFVGGLVTIGVGVVIIILGLFLAKYLLLILGIILTIYGVYHIIVGSKAIFAILVNALILVVGVLLIVGGAVTGEVVWIICKVAGVILIVEGVLGLFSKK